MKSLSVVVITLLACSLPIKGAYAKCNAQYAQAIEKLKQVGYGEATMVPIVLMGSMTCPYCGAAFTTYAETMNRLRSRPERTLRLIQNAEQNYAGPLTQNLAARLVRRGVQISVIGVMEAVRAANEENVFCKNYDPKHPFGSLRSIPEIEEMFVRGKLE